MEILAQALRAPQLASGMTVVAVFASHPATKSVSFLWHNPIGMIAVVATGVIVSMATGGRAGSSSQTS